MIVITAGNFRFRSFIRYSLSQIKKFNYSSVVYDLGGLNLGEKFTIENEEFQKNGSYLTINKSNNWTSKALHKPEIILNAMKKYEDNSLFCYLDADAIIMKSVDELYNLNFDIATTIRKENELGSILGDLNAGVLFLRKNLKSIRFIEEWIESIKEIKNDQLALNKLFFNTSGINKLTLPTEIYNNYYCDNNNAKILHFKSEKKIRLNFLNFNKLI